jgi:hypothetical protein
VDKSELTSCLWGGIREGSRDIEEVVQLARFSGIAYNRNLRLLRSSVSLDKILETQQALFACLRQASDD